MQYHNELCQLIIRNMAIVEEAPKVLDEVEKYLFGTINKRIEARVSKNQRWTGIYTLVSDEEKNETSFSPSDWPDDGSLAHYWLYCQNDNDLRWLSCALGLQGASLGFQFVVEQDLGSVSKKDNKTRCQKFYTNTQDLHKAGFLYEEDKQYNLGFGLYLPFTLDAEALASEFPDIDKSLAPLDEALEKLFSVHNHFDAFVKELS